MQCMVCGAEMILMGVTKDETFPVPGFERHTFMCSVCHDTEQRVVFDKHARERDTDTPSALTKPSIAPPSPIQRQRVGVQSFLGRALAKIRSS